jgi:hypothetical protein
MIDEDVHQYILVLLQLNYSPSRPMCAVLSSKCISEKGSVVSKLSFSVSLLIRIHGRVAVGSISAGILLTVPDDQDDGQ